MGDDCGAVGAGSKKALLRDETKDIALSSRPPKRPRAADAPSEVHVFHILKKHEGSKDPTGRGGEKVTCTKSRAMLALANMRKRIVMIQNPAEGQRALAEFAREQSNCESAVRGGNLGRVTPGILEPVLDDAAFALAIGELSEPIEGPEGIHLLMRVA